MPLAPEILHARLTQLLSEMPDITAGPTTNVARQWIARATVLVEETGDFLDITKITTAADRLSVEPFRSQEVIITVLHRAVARAEHRMPAGAKGGFIAAGSPFDALATVGKVLAGATSDA